MAWNLWSYLGVNSIIQEESEGTIEFLYSKPVSRSKIYEQNTVNSVTFFALVLLLISNCPYIPVKPEDLETMTIIMDIKGMFIEWPFRIYLWQ